MLTLTHVAKSYDKDGPVFQDLSFSIRPGECMAIVGPNGCGKSTLLNLLAGLQKQDEGTILFNAREIQEAKVGYVFQDFSQSLFPWLTVEENIAFPLMLRGIKKQEAKHMVDACCRTFHSAIRLEAYPHQLSGGQKQMVSILRSLIIRPDIFLLDEPFGSLDYTTRLRMGQAFSELWRQTQTPTCFVSHDVDEAVLLSTTILVLSHRPTRIIAKIDNPLPFPRTKQMMTDPCFIERRNQVLNLCNQ